MKSVSFSVYALKSHIRLTTSLPFVLRTIVTRKVLLTSEKLATRFLFVDVFYPYLMENYGVRSELTKAYLNDTHFHLQCF
jgi:hypothetical protein